MGEISNNTRKIYTSLSSVKGRREHNLFMAQGEKCVSDTLDYFEVHTIIATREWIESHKSIAETFDISPAKTTDMQRISTLSTSPDVIAIYKIPDIKKPNINGNLVIALDGVQDPGNLGTIMRVADWMGVDTILASKDTVDVWSPKVVQATMGAISRVKVFYTDLPSFIDSHAGTPVYGTFLDGDDIYEVPLSKSGIVVMGNEGKGISEELARKVNRRLFIPPYPAGRHTSESLNVAIATAITLSEFRRRLVVD